MIEDMASKGNAYAARYKEKWEWLAMDDTADNKERFSRKLFQTTLTFSLVTFAWLFFRAGGLKDSVEILRNMFSDNNWVIFFDGSLYELGVARNYMTVLLMSIVALFIVDYHKYHGRDVADMLLGQGWYFRVTIYMLMIFTILLYGCYGELYDVQQFIYFQF